MAFKPSLVTNNEIQKIAMSSFTRGAHVPTIAMYLIARKEDDDAIGILTDRLRSFFCLLDIERRHL